MPPEDLLLLERARFIRSNYQYIEDCLIPRAKTPECRRLLREEYNRAWRTHERASADTLPN